jgi:hypothetical protein
MNEKWRHTAYALCLATITAVAACSPVAPASSSEDGPLVAAPFSSNQGGDLAICRRYAEDANRFAGRKLVNFTCRIDDEALNQQRFYPLHADVSEDGIAILKVATRGPLRLQFRDFGLKPR